MDHDDRQSSRILSRREMLALFGTVGAAALFNCSSAQKMSAPADSLPPCVGQLEQTEGPYFVDEKLDRSDIRVDTASGKVSEGLPLEIEFRVSQIGNDNSCQPLAKAMVDLWHCDALGAYSDVRDRQFNTEGRNFLRGFQVTDAKGIARFTTIYPGWYPGRTVHIHFKIRTKNSSGGDYDFTSQLYFDDALTDKVHAQAPYAQKGQRNLKNNRDGIFRDGGRQLTLALAETEKGYKGVFEIGLQTS